MKIEKDYLQVFKLIRSDDTIKIEHSQEVPEYKNRIVINPNHLSFNNELKVYVIDSGEYSTMLLPEEY